MAISTKAETCHPLPGTLECTTFIYRITVLNWRHSSIYISLLHPKHSLFLKGLFVQFKHVWCSACVCAPPTYLLLAGQKRALHLWTGATDNSDHHVGARNLSPLEEQLLHRSRTPKSSLKSYSIQQWSSLHLS